MHFVHSTSVAPLDAIYGSSARSQPIIHGLACWRKYAVFCVFMTQEGWAEDTTHRIAATVKALRGKRSTQWLADRTAQLGHPISRTALSNLEVGRKRAVDVPELIVLARALGVPPLLLLYPAISAGEVEVLPGHRTSSWSAAQWFAGKAPYTGTDETGKVYVDFRAYEDGARLLRLAQQDEELQLLLSRLPMGGKVSTTELVENLRQRENVAARIRDVRREMKTFGGEPLPWPDGILHAATEADE